MFSILHLIDDDTRMAMGDAVLENELFVRCHRKILDAKFHEVVADLRELHHPPDTGPIRLQRG